MSTHAAIAVPSKKAGTFQVAYLHFDGYKAHALDALAEGFGTAEAAAELVAAGDIRTIDAEGTFEVLSDPNAPQTVTGAGLEQAALDMGARFVYVLTSEAGWIGVDLSIEPLNV